jgi:hypothetical protein
LVCCAEKNLAALAVHCPHKNAIMEILDESTRKPIGFGSPDRLQPLHRPQSKTKTQPVKPCMH